MLWQRREAGFSRREILTVSGTVPYLDGGTGRVVVLLHGYQDQKDTWIEVASQLTDRFRVLIPDLHGFGENHTATNGDYRPAAQAGRVHDFLLALGVGPVHLGGVSMGGEIAGAYAAVYPGETHDAGVLQLPPACDPTRCRCWDAGSSSGDDVFHVTDRRTLDTLIAQIASGDSGLALARRPEARDGGRVPDP